MISQFHGVYDFLSNFYPHEIYWDEMIYPSSEHAYQAAKTLDKKLRRRFTSYPGLDDEGKLYTVFTAKQAKRAGKLLPLRSDWESVKLKIMKDILKNKFSGPEMIRLLLITEGELIEKNYWHDNFWGACECENCIGIEKQNMLGKLLMEVRNEIEF